MTLRESLPAINSVGYEGRQPALLSSNVTGDDAVAAAATKAREDYAKMQYYEMFRDGKNVYTALPDRGQRDRPQPGTGYDQASSSGSLITGSSARRHGT